MTNEQLVTLIQNHIDEADNMLKLWQQNKNFISMIARRYRERAEVEDLEQEGFIGLCNAVRLYSAEDGALFITYAAYHIKASISRYIENTSGKVRLPVYARDKVTALKKLRAEFYLFNGRMPNSAEEMHFLGLNKEKYDQLLQTCQISEITSLDEEIYNDEGKSASLRDSVASDVDIEEDICEQVHLEELKEVLWGIVDELPAEQCAIIKNMYKYNMELPKACALANVPYKKGLREREKAMRTLRKSDNTAMLRPFLPDQVSSLAYSGGVAGFQRTWTSSTERAAFKDMGIK